MAKFKATQEKYEGKDIGNAMAVSDDSEKESFKIEKTETNDGMIKIKGVGGETNSHKVITMNDSEGGIVNTAEGQEHEVAHTLGLTHPPWEGTTGIMGYPPEEWNQENINNLINNDTLENVEVK